MAFREVADLDAEVTTALGGVNRKTGKPNPTKVEGWFLGSKKVESKKSKSGFAFIHFLQTAKGNLGVWGKTDLDRKMGGVTPGTMIRITHTGMLATPNGDMYKYKVEVDADNTIEVATASPASASDDDEPTAFSSSQDEEVLEETDVDQDEVVDDVPAYAPPRKASAPAATPDAARQAKVKELLAKAQARRA